MKIQSPLVRDIAVPGRRVVAALALAIAVPGDAPARDGETWATLAPLFAERCVMCHGGGAASLELRLDSLDGLRAGSINGPVVADGDPAGSELVRRLRGESLPRMPLTGPPYLAEADILRVERWIAAGLPAGEADVAAVAVPASDASDGGPVTYARVAPILASHCVRCHADGGLLGTAPEGFRMTSYDLTLATDDRARVVAGEPLASELLRRVRGQALPRMPFDGPPWLTDEDVALIERWIVDGARDASGARAPMPSGAAVRLHGTLSGEWTLDGLPLSVNAGTRLDASPQPGDYVQVRGRVAATGSIRVERIRLR